MADLVAAVSDGLPDLSTLARYYEAQYAIGTWLEGVGMIDASTHPLRQAGPVLTRSALALDALPLELFDGQGGLSQRH